MKNTNNKSLNDLFRAARDEASTELLSDREAEQLLVNGTMRSLPTKPTIGQQLYGLLFSTPLKIGITTMTTATCIALGVFAFWPQAATNNSLTSHNSLVSQGTKMTNGTKNSCETVAAFQDSLPQIIYSQSPTTLTLRKTESLPIAPPAPIATADSLHPIELSPEQLAQLGIVLEDNGDIDFYTKVKATGDVNKFDLPSSWGMRLHLGEKFSDSELAGLTIPKFPPRLVTEPDGAKRLFCFESDTSFTKAFGNGMMTMIMHKDMKVAPGGFDSIQQNVNDDHVLLNLISDSSHTNDSNFNLDLDSSFKTSDGLATTYFANVRATINDDYDNIKRIDRAIHELGYADSGIHRIELTIDELRDRNAESDVNAELSVTNSTLQQGEKIAREFGDALTKKNMCEVDSIVHTLPRSSHVQTEDNEIVSTNISQLRSDDSLPSDINNSLNIKISGDSTLQDELKLQLNINANNVKEIDSEAALAKQLINEIGVSLRSGTVDSIGDSLKSEEILRIDRKLFGSKMDSLTQYVHRGRPVDFGINMNVQRMLQPSISLDHLIPIRVRNMKNAEHPNELIFWYEATPEVTAVIPDASVSEPAPQSKQLAISVYPNPTNGPATIHFDLANEPKAYFSVRNLLGQQVLDGGMTSGASGDMKLDLSSLDAGVYLLVTTTDDGERDVERVVVAK